MPIMVHDDLVGACSHGQPLHYRYPCRRCLGSLGYLRQRARALLGDVRCAWRQYCVEMGLRK